ncbi:MAG: flippase-like domain-containing protein [Candidatus Bathyarchaeota archaeon]|jgi:uncharacterized protein (TIRG00374 family)|nr:flippase-like domain-containing protein [Candidatus Bathyarchaeota archaeon]
MGLTERIQERRYLTKKSLLVLIVGISAYFVFLFFYTDVGAIISALQSADLGLYLLAFGAAVANMLFHSLTWWNILDNLKIKSTFRNIFSFMWIGHLVDILVPAESVSGEIARVYLMNRSLNGAGARSVNNSTGRIVTSILSHRIIYTGISLIGLIGGSILFELNYGVSQPLASLIVVMILGASFSLLLFVLVSFRKTLAWRVVNALLRILGFVTRGRLDLDDLTPKARSVLDAFHEGFHLLRERSWTLIIPVGFSVMAWLLNLSITYFALVALNVDVPLSAIIVVFSIIDALQTIPVGIPGEVGVIEIAMTALYTALGVLPAVSATITILVRIVTMWFKLLVGIPTIHYVSNSAVS